MRVPGSYKDSDKQNGSLAFCAKIHLILTILDNSDLCSKVIYFRLKIEKRLIYGTSDEIIEWQIRLMDSKKTLKRQNWRAQNIVD